MAPFLNWLPLVGIVFTGLLLIAAIGWAGNRLLKMGARRNSVFARPMDQRIVGLLQAGALAVGFAIAGQAPLGVALGLLLYIIALIPQTHRASS